MHKYKTIEAFFADQTLSISEQVEMTRRLIKEAEPKVTENIKWNAPNYVHEGEDRLTFNVMNKQHQVKLLLHMGATKKEDKKGKPVLSDDEGIVEWNSDIRGTITFEGLQDIQSKQDALKRVIQRWLLIAV